MPEFSIILPSYLGSYLEAATNREDKLRRAIQSVIDQTIGDWELIVVADGCDKSFDIACEFDDERVNCYLIKKQPIWTGLVRNFGISVANGEKIVYLDSDDYYGKDHLLNIKSNFGTFDWVWYDDYVGSNTGFKKRTCQINVRYQYGTSNFCHKKSLNAKWTTSGYGMDDWGIVDTLRNISKNYGKIEGGEYHVCHIPKLIDI